MPICCLLIIIAYISISVNLVPSGRLLDIAERAVVIRKVNRRRRSNIVFQIVFDAALVAPVLNAGVAVCQFGAVVTTFFIIGCGISESARNGFIYSFRTFEISERGCVSIVFQFVLTLIEHAFPDRGFLGAIVFAIVHILLIGARTDNLPIRTLDIPVDSAVGDVFPSWIVIFQTDLPAAVVLGVYFIGRKIVTVFIFITVKRIHHRHFHFFVERSAIGENDRIGRLLCLHRQGHSGESQQGKECTNRCT